MVFFLIVIIRLIIWLFGRLISWVMVLKLKLFIGYEFRFWLWVISIRVCVSRL